MVDEPSDTQLPEPQQAPSQRSVAGRSSSALLSQASWYLLSEPCSVRGLSIHELSTPSLPPPVAAEGAQVWKDFFIAQDCFIDAVVEVADAELAFNEGLTLLDETDLLARHVRSSRWSSFADVSVLPLHGNLASARDSIVAHYEVWDGHLGESAAILSGLDPDPTLLAVAVSDLGRCGRGGRRGHRIDFQRLGIGLSSWRRSMIRPARRSTRSSPPAKSQCSRGAV